MLKFIDQMLTSLTVENCYLKRVTIIFFFSSEELLPMDGGGGGMAAEPAPVVATRDEEIVLGNPNFSPAECK